MQITIATSPQMPLNLAHDIALVRTAILYADRTILCSPAYSILLPLLRLGKLKPEEQLDFLERSIPYSGLSDSQKELALAGVREERHLLSEGNLIQRLFNRQKVQKRLKINWERLKKETRPLNQDVAFEEFSTAIKGDLLHIHSFKTLESADIENKGFYSDVPKTTSSLVKEFIQFAGQSVSDGSTYPLFDNGTAAEIQKRIGLGTMSVSDLHIDRSKHVALAGDLLRKLPLLEDVPIDEIIDIRSELEKPLVRFRSGLIEYSEEIKSAPWDRDFEIEADQLFRKYVGPAIQDISDEIQASSSLAGLLAQRVTAPVLAGGGILITLDQLSVLPYHAALALGGLAAGAGILHGAYKEWQKERLESEKNQMFFYYELSNRLS
jgi:hypothetical protein